MSHGHLVHIQHGLPVFARPIVQGPPVRPVGDLVDVNDSPPIGIVGILGGRLHHPTPALGQCEVSWRPGGSLPTRHFIPRLHPFFIRPGETAHLTRRDLASIFDQTGVVGQLLGGRFASRHRLLDPAWRDWHQHVLHTNQLPVHVLDLPTPAVYVIAGNDRAKQPLRGVRGGQAAYSANGGDEGPDRLPFLWVRVPPLQRRDSHHVVWGCPE